MTEPTENTEENEGLPEHTADEGESLPSVSGAISEAVGSAPAAESEGDSESGGIEPDSESVEPEPDSEPDPASGESAPEISKPQVGVDLSNRPIVLPEGIEMPSDAPVPIDPGFRVFLPDFEGPLDLLLHLIKKHELDILDLPIAFVTKCYVEYIELMEKLNLDIAAEYLVMAATLALIKSRSLLPKAPDEEDDFEEDEGDPREELIRRLLSYQKYKRAAEQLGSRGVAGRDVFPRGVSAPTAEGPAELAEFSVFKLIDVFQKILKRHEGTMTLAIDAEQVTIHERIGHITELLTQRTRVPFEDLFEGYATTYDLVVSFLALLEMAKMRLIRIFQSEVDGPIYMEARFKEPQLSDEEAVASAMGPLDPPNPSASHDDKQDDDEQESETAVVESPWAQPADEPDDSDASFLEESWPSDGRGEDRSESTEMVENAADGDMKPSPE